MQCQLVVRCVWHGLSRLSAFFVARQGSKCAHEGLLSTCELHKLASGCGQAICCVQHKHMSTSDSARSAVQRKPQPTNQPTNQSPNTNHQSPTTNHHQSVGATFGVARIVTALRNFFVARQGSKCSHEGLLSTCDLHKLASGCR